MNVPAASPRLSRRASGFVTSEIREFTKLLNDPDIVLLAGGVPSADLFPVAQLRELYAEVLSDAAGGGAALQYTQSEGHNPLREWLCAHMRARKVNCTAANILIVNGSQQALDLLGKVFLDRGDTVAVSSPTYLGALQALSVYEVKYATISSPVTDEDGRRLAAARPKLMYCMADSQNPTGRSLSLSERRDLTQLAARCGALLVEDNAYSELHYEGEVLPGLASLALDGAPVDAGHSVYLGSFSKSVAPGLRLGWVVAPTWLMEKLVIAKQAGDLQSSTINQVVLTHFLERHFTSWSRHICAAYRERRDVMLGALERTPLARCVWMRPVGGYFIWVEGPPGLDAHSLLRRAITEARVAFVPGRAFHVDGSGGNTFRLSYSHARPEHVPAAIARLAALLE